MVHHPAVAAGVGGVPPVGGVVRVQRLQVSTYLRHSYTVEPATRCQNLPKHLLDDSAKR